LPQNFGDIYAGPANKRLLPPGENIQPGPLEHIVYNCAQPRVYDTVVFTVVGNHYKPVKVTDVSIHVVSRESPPGGTLVYAAPQGASDVEAIGFDLDSPDLTARVTTNDGTTDHATTAHYFNDRQITLNRFESLDLKLVVFTSDCLCRFNFTSQLTTATSIPSTTTASHGRCLLSRHTMNGRTPSMSPLTRLFRAPGLASAFTYIFDKY
jgi:hypothetical protein